MPQQWIRGGITVVGYFLVGYGCHSLWGWSGVTIAIGIGLIVTMQVDRFQ
jgi:hypothetical protein